MWGLMRNSLLEAESRLGCFRRFYGSSLFSPESLGTSQYEMTRRKVCLQFESTSVKYLTKMRDFVTDDPKAMIFTEDLKNMLYLCEKKDVELLSAMIKKFNKQNTELRFGNFVFGPVVMRMFHHLNLPNEAFKIFNDPSAEGFFDQIVTYKILMDLLYKNEKYDEIHEVFEYLTAKQLYMMKYPKECVVLIMAACYKQNSKESLDYSVKLWSDLLNAGHNILRKSITFFAGLALNQGAPHITLESLSLLQTHKYITILNLKVAALAELNRMDDIIPLLRSLLDYDKTTTFQNGFTQDVISRVQESVDRNSANKIMVKEYEQILKGLSERNFILPITLDSLICKEIQHIERDNTKTDLHSSFNNYKRKPTLQGTRKGLSQMY